MHVSITDGTHPSHAPEHLDPAQLRTAILTHDNTSVLEVPARVAGVWIEFTLGCGDGPR